jgi:benzodiazapine receptor
MRKVRLKDLSKLIISIVACLAAGAIGSIFTRAAIPKWYVTLQKPPFSPPNWVFASVWTILYILMGIAVFLVWRKGFKERGNKVALIAFLVQLVLNGLWSFAFFGLESPLLGLIVILMLWLAILATVILFFKISRLASVLLWPYLLWVTFAMILNTSIWMLNR